MTRLIRPAALLAGLLALSGCGDGPTGSVAGTVTVDGQKLTSGTVSFIVEGLPYTGNVAPDGTYFVGPMPVGPAIVVVADPPGHDGPNQVDKETLEKARLAKQPPPQPKAKPSLVPVHYGDPTRSPLKTEVKTGTTTYDIPLTKK